MSQVLRAGVQDSGKPEFKSCSAPCGPCSHQQVNDCLWMPQLPLLQTGDQIAIGCVEPHEGPRSSAYLILAVTTSRLQV